LTAAVRRLRSLATVPRNVVLPMNKPRASAKNTATIETTW
jgi:hypothetical protein